MTPPVRTTVTFSTNLFNETEERDYFINPGCFGDDLCKWMIAKLTDAGIICDTAPDQDDFGWHFQFWIGDVEYCFVCALRPGEGDAHSTWIAWIERCAGFISTLFGGRHKGIAPEALRQIHAVLVSAEGISGIRWHGEKEFDRGNEEAGAPTPD